MNRPSYKKTDKRRGKPQTSFARRKRSGGNAKSSGGRRVGGRRMGGISRRAKVSPSTILKFIENKTAPQEENKPKRDSIKNTLDSFSFSDQLKKNINTLGITEFTPIQDQAIPEILASNDIIAVASTGTGKTAAALIPLIVRAIDNKKEKVLILCPTRELGAQIEREFKILAEGSGLRSTLCVGGANIKPQIKSLHQKSEFIIGTPGRVLDLLRGKHLPAGELSAIVLDEADRMLDMGFLEDIKTVLRAAPTDRNILLFSATMPEKLRQIASDFLVNPKTITIEKDEAFDFIKQDVVHYTHNKKFEILHGLLKQEEFKRVFIFGSMKHSVDKLTRSLRSEGIKAMSIHGNKTNRERMRTLDALKAGKISVVVGTDVIARGIHVEGITHIINYDLPETLENYIHRIGRTGRSQTSGCAITFLPE